METTQSGGLLWEKVPSQLRFRPCSPRYGRLLVVALVPRGPVRGPWCAFGLFLWVETTNIEGTHRTKCPRNENSGRPAQNTADFRFRCCACPMVQSGAKQATQGTYQGAAVPQPGAMRPGSATKRNGPGLSSPGRGTESFGAIFVHFWHFSRRAVILAARFRT